ncbi:MAG: hypothetical protein ABFC76_04845, partial [Fervidobacterium sp.]
VVYEVNDKVNWAGVNILDRDAEETTEAIHSSVHLDFTLARVCPGKISKQNAAVKAYPSS